MHELTPNASKAGSTALRDQYFIINKDICVEAGMMPWAPAVVDRARR
jgi:hypothetical protein